MLQGMFGLANGEPVLSGGRVYLWLAAMLIIVWFMPNSWQLFRKYDSILVPNIAKGTGKEMPVPTGKFRIFILAPFGLTLCIVSLLVVIARGGDTQGFIYMIF